MRVTVLRAWPEGHDSVSLELEEGASLADAVRASALATEDIAGYAIFGTRADLGTLLRDGDRVELLRPLLVDPKEARRRRAGSQRGSA